ncbi:MAG: flagellar biosynthesis anti-sigma factor FlgM [Steroidobacteraceae bacterium]
MTNKITGVAGPVIGPAERSTGPGRGTTEAREPRGSASGDSVRLTATAQELRAATEALAGVPASDPQRVAAVKTAIERGEYKPDPAKIASQLLKMEDQI